MNKVNVILRQALSKINPPEEEIESITNFVDEVIFEIKKQIKKLKIDAAPFIGGSFAKGTMTKKGQYDVDLFIRFEEKYKDKEISKLTEKILRRIKQTRDYAVVHGSRDYFKINVNPWFFIEIIPVKKVKNPKEAENITDLSYFHVDYIKKKLNSDKFLEEVRLTKAFSHSCKCYGAEGYIKGFSGYSIELLICHYKTFLNLIKNMEKIKEREFIDIEKLYKNKNEILMNMNSAKLLSPIILIDPTYKERNALAALSSETLQKFQRACKKFMQSPSLEMFEIKKIDFEKLKKESENKKENFVLLEVETDKQEGDIAGSKLIKFYKHLIDELERFYDLSKKEFEYDGKSCAKFFFSGKNKKELILNGPMIKDKKNVKIFKKKHKKVIVKKGRCYAVEKFDKPFKEFLKQWKIANLEKTVGMHIATIDLN